MTTQSAAPGLFGYAGSGLWLDAFTIALGQASDGKWYTSTLELQLASILVCVACRGVRTLMVNATTRMPLSLWDDGDSGTGSLKTPEARRLPALRAAGVEWLLPADMFVPILSESGLLRGVQWLKIGDLSGESLRSDPPAVSRWGDLPLPLTRSAHSPRTCFKAMLEFLGRRENNSSMQKRGTVSWPPALRQLSLGSVRGSSYMDLEGLPSCLERLTLGGNFNQSIESAAWPVSLKRLTLGLGFNQPIVNAVWPASLLHLAFGMSFNRPIVDVVWPSSLQQLTFGHAFNQPLAEAVWPASLLGLVLGRDFDKRITGVSWPVSLRKLAFGYMFNQSLVDMVWPSSFQQLTIDGKFNQPIDEVVWPASLTRLELWGSFNHPIENVSWPSALQSLTFGHTFDQPVQGVLWPASLRWLVFDYNFMQPIDGMVWPPSLELYMCGQGVGSPKNGAHWPPGEDEFDYP